MDLFTEAEKYMHGDGVQCDYIKAFELYGEAAAAGDAAAAKKLAHIYEDGEIARKDLKKALEYYMLSARLGGAKEKFTLALIYDKGTLAEKNEDEALKYYLESAELGYEKAQNNLANIYKKQGDYIKAFTWFEKAAQGGSSAAKQNLDSMLAYNSEAIYTLAVHYSDSGDDANAEKYYKKSSDLNYIPAMEKYAEILAWQNDMQGAEQIYKRCIALGHYEAAMFLGDMYMKDSPKKAEKYYKSAYNHKIPGAAEKYAECLKSPDRFFKKTKKAEKIMQKK